METGPARPDVAWDSVYGTGWKAGRRTQPRVMRRGMSEPGAMDTGKIADHSVAPELQRLRDSIDNIDAALIHILAERFKCTKLVGELKARHGLPPADPVREAHQIARLRALAKTARLDPDFAEKFLTFIVQEVIRHHEAIERH
jgi:chorismate mutase